MAERRMFTKKITESDSFLELPASTQNLYFHLNMEADDDGFINCPKKIMRVVGASEDDMRLLLVKKFVLAFESGVVVIKHWRMHNLLRHDRYHPTQYQEEYEMLTLDGENKYHLETTKKIEEEPKITWQPNGNQMATEVRLGKDRLGKDSNKTRFTRPTIQEVRDYCAERKNTIDPERFFDFYEANGWVQGKGKPIKDWKACVRTWERKETTQSNRSDIVPTYDETVNADFDEDRFNEIMKQRETK